MGTLSIVFFYFLTMSTRITQEVREKILDEIALERTHEDIVYGYLDSVENYVANQGNAYGFVQEWLWRGIDIPENNADDSTWTKIARQLIEKVLFDEMRDRLSNIPKSHARAFLLELLEEYPQRIKI